jgi:uncharacterized delta-60 repeat protein
MQICTLIKNTNQMNFKMYRLIAAFLLASSVGFSQVITPDLTFGNQGTVVHDVNTNEDVFNDMTRQTDGKLLAVGYSVQQAQKEVSLMRFNANGSVDSSFGLNGFTEMNVGPIHSTAKAVCLQADGKILVTGYYDNNFFNDAFIARFDTTGDPDSTFGNTGLITYVIGTQYDEFHDIAVQADGKIIVAGRTWQNNSYDFVVMRVMPDGSADSTFGVNGLVTTDFNGNYDCITSLMLLANGQILVSGHTEIGASYFAAAKYNSDGSPDNTFGTNGKLSVGSGSRFDRCYGQTILSDSSIILAGKYHNSNVDALMLVKLNEDGLPDTLFGVGGVRLYPTVNTTDVLTDIVTQTDGKLIACGMGDGNKAMLMRILPDGTPDSTFGNQGIYSGNNGGMQAGLNALILLPDHSVVAAGFIDNGSDFDFMVSKVLNNVSTSVWEQAKHPHFSLYPNPAHDFIHIQTEVDNTGEVLVAISDITGRTVSSEIMQLSNGHLQIDLPGSLNEGIYTLTVKSSGFTGSAKFIHQ